MGKGPYIDHFRFMNEDNEVLACLSLTPSTFPYKQVPVTFAGIST
jgi:hypothetical protein